MENNEYMKEIVVDLQFCSRPLNSVGGQSSFAGSIGNKIGHYATVVKTSYGYYILEGQQDGIVLQGRFQNINLFSSRQELDQSQKEELKRSRITLGQLYQICKGKENLTYHWLRNNCAHSQNRIRKYFGIKQIKNPSNLFKYFWRCFNIIYFLRYSGKLVLGFNILLIILYYHYSFDLEEMKSDFNDFLDLANYYKCYFVEVINQISGNIQQNMKQNPKL